MASVTIARRALENAVLVTGLASLRCVAPHQWEEVVVVEFCAQPIRIGCLVACIAIGWESCVAVVGLCCRIVFVLMASVTLARSSRVRAVLVAGCARHRSMNSHERENGAVVERNGLPACIGSLVAVFAGGWESCGPVIRLLRVFVILAMAGVAVHFTWREALLDVASIAGQPLVLLVELDAGFGCVIVFHIGPRTCVVALLAIVSKARTVAVILPSNPVTVVAPRRCALDDRLQMARFTGYREMPPGEREDSDFVERATHAVPLLLRVAFHALHSQSALVRILMASAALSRHGPVPDDVCGRRRIFDVLGLMALVTDKIRVASSQREIALCVRESRRFKSGCCVARFAILFELALMDIRVARGALR